MENNLPLRDIHLPEPSSWWPPAPGWWLVLLLIIVVVALIWWVRNLYQKRAVLRSAESQLKEIKRSYRKEKDSQLLLRDLSELIRRVMISHYHREDVSSLVDEAWLLRLDLVLESKEFSQGVGAVLARGPYQQQVEFSEEKLIALVEQLLRKVLTPTISVSWRRGND